MKTIDNFEPSVGEQQLAYDFPITGSGKYISKTHGKVKLKLTVDTYGFVPTFTIWYNQLKVTVSAKEDIPRAELALLLAIDDVSTL